MSDLEDYRNSRIAALAKGTGVFGMAGWIDPSGEWWMAPLGSPDPVPGEMPPVAWLPIKILKRTDRL